MVNIQTTEEQIVTDWITHSEEESDNLNDFPSSGPEVFIETSTSTNTSSQNQNESNNRKRKTSNLTSGI